MAGERQLPGLLGLYAYWTAGTGGYKPQMDENFRKLSVMAQLRVLSRVAALPGTPADGDIHILTTTKAINVRDNGAWTAYAASEGLIAWDIATNEYLKYNGADWEALLPSYSTARTTYTDSFALTSADFSGQKIIYANKATALLATVAAGLTGLEPLTIIQAGAGKLTVQPGAGVTINSADGFMSTRLRYSSLTLIPTGVADFYDLIGDLAA